MGDKDKPGATDDLGDAGKRALDAERRARREAEQKLKDANDRVKELEDKDKSDGQKALDDKAKAERERDEARAQLLRIEIGAAKGLSPAQARRLVGTTKEELEADADAFLAESKPAGDGGKGGDGDKGGDAKGGAPRKPTEDLQGGGDPTHETSVSEPFNPRKAAESLPRF